MAMPSAGVAMPALELILLGGTEAVASVDPTAFVDQAVWYSDDLMTGSRPSAAD